MTAKRVEVAEDDPDFPVPQWQRPLSFAEQDALIKEAEDELDRGEGIPHEVAKVEIAKMIAEARAAGQRQG